MPVRTDAGLQNSATALENVFRAYEWEVNVHLLPIGLSMKDATRFLQQIFDRYLVDGKYNANDLIVFHYIGHGMDVRKSRDPWLARMGPYVWT